MSIDGFVFCICEETWVNPKTGYGCVSKCPMSGTLNCPLEKRGK